MRGQEQKLLLGPYQYEHIVEDGTHLLHPRIFAFHNVRGPYFRNELHLYEQNDDFHMSHGTKGILAFKETSWGADWRHLIVWPVT